MALVTARAAWANVTCLNEARSAATPIESTAFLPDWRPVVITASASWVSVLVNPNFSIVLSTVAMAGCSLAKFPPESATATASRRCESCNSEPAFTDTAATATAADATPANPAAENFDSAEKCDWPAFDVFSISPWATAILAMKSVMMARSSTVVATMRYSFQTRS